MCFSAEASFGLSAALVPCGAFCLTTAIRKQNWSHLPIALVPLAFGIQQFCEGLVWVGLGQSNESLANGGSYIYLFFALLFWPVWIPLSLLVLERRTKQRTINGIIMAVGLAGSLALYLSLIVNPEVLAIGAEHHSIQYKFEQSFVFQMVPWTLWKVLYLAIVAVPILISERGEAVVVGFVLVVLAALTHYVDAHAFVSLWCFFAAFLSLYLCYYFYQIPMPANEGVLASTI